MQFLPEVGLVVQYSIKNIKTCRDLEEKTNIKMKESQPAFCRNVMSLQIDTRKQYNYFNEE